MATSVDIVIPVFNEIECLPELTARLEVLATKLSQAPLGCKTRVIFVSDGSTDGTDEWVSSYKPEFFQVALVSLRRNFGHQLAMAAGLQHSTAEYVAVIDADLQDPPELIQPMLLELIHSQQTVVYGQRISRDGETFLKLQTARVFYRFIRWASGLDVPLDTGDFRVFTAQVRDELNRLPEHHRVVRLLIPWLGFQGQSFPYSRAARHAGRTKYSTRKMVRLASHAILAFSTIPVRIVQLTAAVLLALSLLLFTSNLCLWVLSRPEVLGGMLTAWNTFLAAIVMCAVALAMGYLMRIQVEVSRRPLVTLDIRRDDREQLHDGGDSPLGEGMSEDRK